MWKQISHGLVRSQRIFSLAPRVAEVRSANLSTLFAASQSKKLENNRKKYINDHYTPLSLVNTHPSVQGNYYLDLICQKLCKNNISANLTYFFSVFTSPFHISAKKFYSTDLDKNKQPKDLDDDDDEWKDKVRCRLNSWQTSKHIPSC